MTKFNKEINFEERILTKSNIRILNNIESIDEYLRNPQAKAQFFRRIGKRTNDALKELSFIVSTLPEKHRTALFTRTNVIPFLSAIIESKPNNKNRTKLVEDAELFSLCIEIANLATFTALQLVKNEYKALLMGTSRVLFLHTAICRISLPFIT